MSHSRFLNVFPYPKAAAAKQQLGVINHELGAIEKIKGLPGISTEGSDTYHRTNDVFGLSLEIDF